MNERDFCYWLQGFFEIRVNEEPINRVQAKIIQDHLQLVFNKITPHQDKIGKMDGLDWMRHELYKAGDATVVDKNFYNLDEIDYNCLSDLAEEKFQKAKQEYELTIKPRQKKIQEALSQTESFTPDELRFGRIFWHEIVDVPTQLTC